MSQNTKPNLMDTEPGGENTPYESANVFTKSHAKAQGQFGDPHPTEASLQEEADKKAKGERTAEKIRFGQAISENGFGGQTTGISGSAQQGDYGRREDNKEDRETTDPRKQQGYGEGSGVGA